MGAGTGSLWAPLQRSRQLQWDACSIGIVSDCLGPFNGLMRASSMSVIKYEHMRGCIVSRPLNKVNGMVFNIGAHQWERIGGNQVEGGKTVDIIFGVLL